MDALSPGVVFERHRIVRKLGRGGAGTVYEAVHEVLGEPRALKVLHHEIDDADSSARFLNEVRTARQLRGRHVVAIHDADVTDGRAWFSMDLVAGEPLAERMDRLGRLSREEVAAVMSDVADCLSRAHALNIVHRDLKPENLLVCAPERSDEPFVVKVLDFGIAKVIAAGASSATSTGYVGTPAWMAPEQYGIGRISPATDVWAFGLLAYHLLTGRLYLRAADANEGNPYVMMTEATLAPLVAASERAKEQGVEAHLPVGFDAWFASCVAREPSQRARDISAIAAELCALLGVTRPLAPTDDAARRREAPTLTDARRETRRPRPVTVVAGAAAVVVVSVLSVAAWRWRAGVSNRQPQLPTQSRPEPTPVSPIASEAQRMTPTVAPPLTAQVAALNAWVATPTGLEV